MKRVFCLALVACLFAALVRPVPVHAATGAYTFGDGGETAAEQGVDGWYYLYSEAFDQGETFPIDAIAECGYPGVAVSEVWWYGDIWTPQTAVPEEAYNERDGELVPNFWWVQYNADGKNVPDGNMSAIIGWEAPSAGVYTVNATVAAGISGSYYEYEATEEVDGVFISIYHNDAILYGHDFAEAFGDAVVALEDAEIELAEGDFLYFIADPNALVGHGYDDCVWNIQIAAEGAEAEEAATEEEATEEAAVEEEATEATEEVAAEEEATEEESTEEEATEEEATEEEATEDAAIEEEATEEAEESAPSETATAEESSIPNLAAGTDPAYVRVGDTVLDAPAPFEENGVVYVPLRAVGEAYGAEFGWDGATQSITINYEGTTVSLSINGADAILVDNSTFVPFDYAVSVFSK